MKQNAKKLTSAPSPFALENQIMRSPRVIP